MKVGGLPGDVVDHQIDEDRKMFADVPEIVPRSEPGIDLLVCERDKVLKGEMGRKTRTHGESSIQPMQNWDNKCRGRPWGKELLRHGT